MSTWTAGIDSLTVNGLTLEVAEIRSISVATTKSEWVMPLAGEGGLKVAPKPAHIEVTVLLKGIRAADVVGIRDALVQLRTRYGAVYTLYGAAEVGDGEIDPADGRVTLRYEAPRAKEDKA